MAARRYPTITHTITHSCGCVAPVRCGKPSQLEMCDPCVEAHRAACSRTSPPWHGKLRRPRSR